MDKHLQCELADRLFIVRHILEELVAEHPGLAGLDEYDPLPLAIDRAGDQLLEAYQLAAKTALTEE